MYSMKKSIICVLYNKRLYLYFSVDFCKSGIYANLSTLNYKMFKYEKLSK